MSGCCPFPRELHRHACTSTHTGRCRRPRQASVCPHSHLLPRPPGFQARSSHGLSHPRSPPPLPQSWSPAPPGCSGPSPGRPGRVGPSCGGPATVGGQWRLVPLHQCQGRRAWLSARLAPRVGCSTESWIPRNAFGKDLFLNTKSAPPASCGNPTFCSPMFWSPHLSSVHRSIRLFICSVLSWGKLGGRKGEERVRKREGRKKKLEGGKGKLAPGAAHRPG